MCPQLPTAPPASSAEVSRVMQGNTRRDTSPERRLRSALHALGFRFRVDMSIPLDGLRVRPDIVFTRRGLAVFVDGCFWHRCPKHGTSPRSNSDYWRAKLDRNVERDRRVDAALERAGWQRLRIWEHEDPCDAAARVASALASASQPQM